MLGIISIRISGNTIKTIQNLIFTQESEHTGVLRLDAC